MNENKNITRVGKILSRQKNPDRHTLVSVCSPEDPEQKEHGVIYFLIEILSSDPTMMRVAKIIEKITVEEYYTCKGDGLTCFESCLKKVNEKLTSLSEEGEIGWIGKINTVIAILEGDILHVTQSGNAEAYLVRGNKITHITEGLSSPSEKPNPLKTFVNIASGELSLNDKVLVSTSELFYHFSLEDLRKICNKFSPAMAASYIVKMLRREEIESINTLIIELAKPEPKKVIEPDSPRILKFQRERMILKKYGSKLGPIINVLVSKSKIGVGKSIEKSKKVYGARIKPNINRFAEEANKRVNEKLNEKYKDTLVIDREKSIFEIQSSNVKDLNSLMSGPTKKGEKEPPSTASAGNVFQSNIFNEKKKKSFSLAPIISFLSPIFAKSISVVKKIKIKSQFFAVAAILLIIIITISGLFSYQKKSTIAKRTNTEEKYLTLKTKVEGAVMANSLGDAPKSQMLLEEAQVEIDDLLKSTYLKEEIEELRKKIEIETDAIFKIYRLEDINSIANFSDPDSESKQEIEIAGLFKVGNKVVAVDKKNHKGLTYLLDQKTMDPSTSLGFDGSYENRAALNDISNVALITSSPEGLYVYNSKNNSTEKPTQITDEPWPKARSIASYLNNIYLLVPGDNQIYKYVNLINSYSTKSNYLAGATNNLADAVDLAIDGSVYVLMKNGEVQRFTAGVKENFALSGMPNNKKIQDSKKDSKSEARIINPIRIVTSQTIQNIYIADSGSNSIFAFDKDGKYKYQFSSSKWNNIKDLWIDGSKGYLISGTELFEIDLK